MQYRKEIDGLRTIAVLPVMLFHAGLAEFSGGFVGVDVFFVISGYLITSMILHELTGGHFSLLSFYERRARRILPALFLVMFVTLVFAWVLMVPGQLSEFGNSIIAVCLFFSNLYFRKAADYFAPSAEQLPLLHTWSLAVEEQYYVVFPVLALLLFKFSRKWFVPVLVLLAILSFGLAEWGLFSRPETRFFVAQTRAWELLLGSLIAVHLTQRPRFRAAIEEALALAGVAMIAVAVFALDRNMQFPGALALLPTVGAGLIILYGQSGTHVGKVLSSPVFVSVGLVSYSAYLWHQPLLALARLGSPTLPPQWFLVLLCAAAVGLAYLSWYFVERPFRDRKVVSRKVFFSFATGALVLLMVLGSTFIWSRGFERAFLARLDSKAQAQFAAIAEADATNSESSMLDNNDCKFWKNGIDAEFMVRFDHCVEKYGKAYVVVGDSHAMDLYNAVFQASTYPFVVGVSKGGCRPERLTDFRCPYSALIKLARDNPAAFRHTFFTQSGADFLTSSQYLPLKPEKVQAVTAFLHAFPSGMGISWLGPQVEPRVELRNINPVIGKYPQPDRGAMDAMVEADRLLASSAANDAQIQYLSKISMVHFSLADDFFQEGKFTYSNRDHWSTFGEAVFGRRIVDGLRDLGFTDL